MKNFLSILLVATLMMSTGVTVLAAEFISEASYKNEISYMANEELASVEVETLSIQQQAIYKQEVMNRLEGDGIFIIDGVAYDGQNNVMATGGTIGQYVTVNSVTASGNGYKIRYTVTQSMPISISLCYRTAQTRGYGDSFITIPKTAGTYEHTFAVGGLLSQWKIQFEADIYGYYDSLFVKTGYGRPSNNVSTTYYTVTAADVTARNIALTVLTVAGALNFTTVAGAAGAKLIVYAITGVSVMTIWDPFPAPVKDQYFVISYALNGTTGVLTTRIQMWSDRQSYSNGMPIKYDKTQTMQMPSF